MSLISDALRRAREESSTGRPAGPTLPAPQPAPRAGRTPLHRAALAAGIGLALVVVVLAAFEWPRRPVAPAAVAVRVGQVERAPQQAMPGVAVVAVPVPDPEPAPDTVAREAPAGGVVERRPAGAAQAAPVPPPDGAPAVRASAPPRPAATTAGSADPRDVFARAELGYATLELDYIVVRPGSTYAQINGREVVVGSMVVGFVVEEITADLVRLRDGSGPLVLRARR